MIVFKKNRPLFPMTGHERRSRHFVKKDIFFRPAVEEENFARLVSSLFLFPLRHALSPPATLNLKARRRKKSFFF